MNANHPILEFVDATIAAAPLAHAGLSHVNAQLLPGTLTLVQVEPGNEQLPLADLAQGLLYPDEGRVLFQGQAWNAIPPEQVLLRRAQTGRVFEEHGWISNLNVNENATLSQRHHTRRPAAAILAEAEALARAFGLSELPKTRPSLVARQDLRRSEWIRAFLGRHMLVILERPMLGVATAHLPRLINAVRETCARKAAVLWLTDNERIEPHSDLPPITRYAMHGLNLVAADQRGLTPAN